MFSGIEAKIQSMLKKLLERHSIPHPSDDEKNGKNGDKLIAVGWIIDMILNGFVWLIIAVLGLSLIDITDKWIRKTLKLMEKVDLWIREFIENLLEWILKKNFKILSSVCANYLGCSCSTRNNT